MKSGSECDLGNSRFSARTNYRDRRAREAFGSAAEAIGSIDPGMSLFLVTRGQFSMIDMVQHVLAEYVGKVKVVVAPVPTGRGEIIKALVAAGAPWDRATHYADVYLEYQEATNNIREYGVINLHPRTGNPINNPYVAVRDVALKKLAGLRSVKAEFLWAGVGNE